MDSASTGEIAVEFRVRYSETDRMGVVYHANYLVWCEIGRTELIRARGQSYAELEKEGVILAVADAAIRYRAAARYDDLIRVVARIDEIRSRTITFGYTISRVGSDDERSVLATATTMLIALDAESRPRTLPLDLIDRLRNE
jgi:acyl-CoA thioester hydrolase